MLFNLPSQAVKIYRGATSFRVNYHRSMESSEEEIISFSKRRYHHHCHHRKRFLPLQRHHQLQQYHPYHRQHHQNVRFHQYSRIMGNDLICCYYYCRVRLKFLRLLMLFLMIVPMMLPKIRAVPSRAGLQLRLPVKKSKSWSDANESGSSEKRVNHSA